MSKCTCPGQGICKSWGFVLICFKVPKQVQERPVQDNWGFNIVLNSLSVPGETQAKPSLCFCKTQSYLCAKTSKRSSKKSMCNCRDQTRKKKRGGCISRALKNFWRDWTSSVGRKKNGTSHPNNCIQAVWSIQTNMLLLSIPFSWAPDKMWQHSCSLAKGTHFFVTDSSEYVEMTESEKMLMLLKKRLQAIQNSRSLWLTGCWRVY